MKRFSIVVFIYLLFSTVSLSAQQELKVGVVLPLTGPVAEYGAAARNGIELARKENPVLFSDIEFLYEDHKYEGRMALSAFNKLVTVDNIDLMYLWGYGPVQAVAPVAEQRKQPLIAVTGEQGIALKRDYIVRFCYHGEQAALEILPYLRKKGVKKIGILKTELAFINSILDGLRKNLADGESVEVIDSFQFENTDFKSSITRLKSMSYDAVGVFLGSGQISQFYRQAASQGYDGFTFGTDFFESKTEIVDSGAGIDGAVFPAPFVSEDFKKRYLDQFGNDLQVSWAANAYDFANYLGRQHSGMKGDKPAVALLEQFRKIKGEQGASGMFNFAADAEQGSGVEFQMVVKKVVGAEIVVEKD